MSTECWHRDIVKLGVANAVIDGTLVAGDVEVEDGRISAVGVMPAGPRGTAVPGFVDMQVNGFAGVDFAAATPWEYRTVGIALAATGVVAYQPTLITLPEDQTLAALGALANYQPATAEPAILGVHLEGPFLSPLRAGAHDPASILDPDLDVAEHLLAVAPVTMMTLAPERPGARELIQLLMGRGIKVSCGHSDATAAEAHDAFDAGATAVTHLFNAQRPFRHRDPGIAGAALIRSDVTASIIADGFHLADETIRVAMAAPVSIALITDAIAAAAQPDGIYPLGDRTVTVTEGKAQLSDGTLAGSVLTMDVAVRNLVDLGVSLPDSISAATAVPARALGRTDLGRLTVGAVADVVVLSNDLEVERTLIAGTQVFPRA
jgi:N-acetylglucosamine-6-phosphate deacetylase